MIALLLLPFRLVFFAAGLPFRVARLPMKVLGVRGTMAFGAGVAIGLLAAPEPGDATRRRLRERYDEWQGTRGATPGWAAGPDR